MKTSKFTEERIAFTLNQAELETQIEKVTETVEIIERHEWLIIKIGQAKSINWK